MPGVFGKGGAAKLVALIGVAGSSSQRHGLCIIFIWIFLFKAYAQMYELCQHWTTLNNYVLDIAKSQ